MGRVIEIDFSGSKKIWIDLDNSPHVPFFVPIIEDLKKQGYKVLLTARNCSQTCGLADLLGLKYKRIGHHHGKNKIIKVIGLIIRAIQLMPIIIREKPVLALSHGSRSQLITSSIFGIQSVTIFDYEYGKALPLIHSKWIIIPEIVAHSEIMSKIRLKIEKDHIFTYPGIKEYVYLPDFRPDPDKIDEIGINGKEICVTIRPPAQDAHYFTQGSEELFRYVVDYLICHQNIQIVMLPRNGKQYTYIKKLWHEWIDKGKIIIPDKVVDGLNLLWHSDLVISGGGTMNREAAALGVPVYSIFRGKIGAVDRYLADSKRLILLESVEDVRTKIVLTKRQRPEKFGNSKKDTLERIVDSIIDVYEKTVAAN